MNPIQTGSLDRRPALCREVQFYQWLTWAATYNPVFPEPRHIGPIFHPTHYSAGDFSYNGTREMREKDTMQSKLLRRRSCPARWRRA